MIDQPRRAVVSLSGSICFVLHVLRHNITSIFVCTQIYSVLGCCLFLSVRSSLRNKRIFLKCFIFRLNVENNNIFRQKYMFPTAFSSQCKYSHKNHFFLHKTMHVMNCTESNKQRIREKESSILHVNIYINCIECRQLVLLLLFNQVSKYLNENCYEMQMRLAF